MAITSSDNKTITNCQIANIMQQNIASGNSLIVNTPNGPVYQIPVVIHVIHTGGLVGSNYNPPTLQLTEMIDYLNKTYSATWPGYPDVNNGGTFIPLQFVLAQRDPNCQPTTGINRVDGSSLAGYATDGMAHNGPNGATEVAVKALSIWPNTKYYNIWVVNKIDSEDGFNSTGSYVAGFAWFPGANPNVDGTVMLAFTAKKNESTLPHEIGHAFALQHTFFDDDPTSSGPPYVCPVNSNCLTDGDMVCDTDPHIRTNLNCPPGSTINTCVTPNAPMGTLIQNIMNYSSCVDRFTPGQGNRVIATLTSSGRASLISSLGGTPIGAVPTSASCNPTGITNTAGNRGPRDINVSDASLTYMNVFSGGYLDDGNQFYVDNTCKHQLDLTAGSTYNVSVSTSGGAQKVKVYVDYNNDGIFQASEEIYNHTGTQFVETHQFAYAVPTVLTVPALVSCTPLRMRVVSDDASTPNVTACGQLLNGQAEDYVVTIKGGGASSGSVAIALTQGTNPSCFSAPLTFTAAPGAGITNPIYTWLVNNTPVGVTTSTFSSSTLANNDIVTVKIKFTGACGFDSAISNAITVQRAATVPATVTIALTSGTNPGCAAQNLTFVATPTNEGTTPSYQWKVNGGNAGTNSNTFSGILNNNDVVTVELVSNSSCAAPNTATSNAITISHITLTANIAITASSTLTCAGIPITFTSNLTNGGNNPQYQWFVNGTAVLTATNSVFTSSSLTNNAIVYCVYAATDVCVTNTTDTSNKITMGVAPVDTPIVNVLLTQGNNPGCLDSLVEFTATVTDHGSNPAYNWYVNTGFVASGLVFSSNNLANGDVVTFTSTATDGGCYTQNTAINNTTMALFTTPTPAVISLLGNVLVSNINGNLQWYGPRGMIVGATGQSHSPDTTGLYYVLVNNNGCYSAPSNKLLVSLTNVNTYDLSALTIYPNPTKGLLTFDWGAKPVNVKLTVYNISGQGLMYEEVRSQSQKTLDLTHFINGMYYVVIRDEQGNSATIPVVVNKN